jgi:hypothetical protein
MTIPVYDPAASYRVGSKVTYNDVVYLKTPYGEEGVPGTADSFWLDIEAEKIEAVAQNQAFLEGIEQVLIDAGYKPQFIGQMLRDHYKPFIPKEQ